MILGAINIAGTAIAELSNTDLQGPQLIQGLHCKVEGCTLQHPGGWNGICSEHLCLNHAGGQMPQHIEAFL